MGKHVKKDDLQVFFNGKDGNKSYVSYKGKVYDVTNSRLWKNGKHVNRHEAGMDLTEAMEAAPHGMDVLERFEHVDTIEGFRVKQERGRKAVIKKNSTACFIRTLCLSTFLWGFWGLPL